MTRGSAAPTLPRRAAPTGCANVRGRRRRRLPAGVRASAVRAILVSLLAFLAVGAPAGCHKKQAGAGVVPSKEVATLGVVEVTGRLVEVRGTFPKNKLYDYAYILKYRVLKVHRGQIDAEHIFVAQYNPLKPRSSAADRFSGPIGGNVASFAPGDVHRMAMEASLDKYMGGVIDKYHGEKGDRYWAIWTEHGEE